MQLGLKDKVVLVTGASKGIGKAVAEAFAAEGAKVAIAARGAEELEKAAREISKSTGSEVIGIPADSTKADDIVRMTNAAVQRFGTVHVLVNNAGGVGEFAPFETLTDDDWLNVLNLNVLSAVRATRTVLPYMQKQKWGRIITCKSKSGDASLTSRVSRARSRTPSCPTTTLPRPRSIT